MPGAELLDRVTAALRGPGTAEFGPDARLGVAYSGGVDSATLLAVAARSLGSDSVVALLGISPSLPAREREAATAVARSIGVEVHEVHTDELASEAYRTNDADRCYHCKAELFTRISDDVADGLALAAVAYGENADDALRPDRPGSRAAREHAVLHPLADAGLTKADVRALAAWLELPVHDKPAAPCLASRIPHGIPVTREKLEAIERAEDVLASLGFREFRVRYHDEIARIEVPEPDLPRLLDPEVRARVVEGVRDAGFRFVTIDLSGIQSGAFTLPLVGVTHGH